MTTAKINSEKNYGSEAAEVVIVTCLGNYFGDITSLLKTHKFSAASTRIQLLPALKAAEKEGATSKIISINNTGTRDKIIRLIGRPKVCIIGKISHKNKNLQSEVALAISDIIPTLKRCDSRIVTTYCDHMLEKNTILNTLYSFLFLNSDHIVTPTEKLRELAHIPTSINSIIEDPWQIEAMSFNECESFDAPKLLWFGQSQNIQHLMKIFNDICEFCSAFEEYQLTILSSREAINAFKQFSTDLSPRQRWVIRYIEWNTKVQPKQLMTLINESHIALLPSDPSNPQKAGASHNRLVDSIQGGCIAIASPLQSYIELEKACIVSNNFANSIDYAAKNYKTLASNFTLARSRLLERFSPKANDQKWRKLITSQLKIANWKGNLSNLKA